MDRKLELRRELLTELSSDDLRGVVGANAVRVMHTLDTDCLTCQTSINGRCDA